jgi:DNA polymerase-3 subunit beta
VKIEGGEVSFAAADGFRLALCNSALSTTDAVSISAIIPARGLAELARIVGNQDEPVTLTLPPGRGQAIFRAQDVELVSQLIEGNFPDYQQLIPESYSTRTVLATDRFLNACRAAQVFAREAAYAARLNIRPGNGSDTGSVEVSANAAETGSNESVVEATVEGDALEIAFNVRYLTDVLHVIDTPNVALETNGEASPGVIRPVGRDDFISVIMPMHIGR